MVGLSAGFLLAAVAALALLLARSHGWRDRFPFAPAIDTGALLAILAPVTT